MLSATLGLEHNPMTLAVAGHPPPLMLNTHGATFAAVPVGPPIGFVDDVTYTEHTVPVDAGTTLVIFTDGLYERPGRTSMTAWKA